MVNSVISSKSTRVYRHRYDSPYYFDDNQNNKSNYSNSDNSIYSSLNKLDISTLSENSKLKLLQKLVNAYRPELTKMDNNLEHEFFILFNAHDSITVNDNKERDYAGNNTHKLFWSEDHYIWHNDQTNTLNIM